MQNASVCFKDSYSLKEPQRTFPLRLCSLTEPAQNLKKYLWEA